MLVPAFVIHGVAALLIILAILALFILGLVTFFRMIARGARRVVDHGEARGRRDPDPDPAGSRTLTPARPGR